MGLALALSPGTAEWWTGQAVTLTWRLPATGAALAAGQIDACRARLMTEATGLLAEDTARAVEDDVLPGAGELTYAQLRSRLRRAVIIADPEGAEDRRKAAERRARVSLYPDDDGTATLTGTSLPAPHAAAAMARITALARALKASGAGGGTDLLRAHIYLGLLLGTLPPIPPPADGGQPSEPTPDDDPPPDDQPPDDRPPDDDQQPGDGGSGGTPGDGRPGDPAPGRSRPGSTPPRDGQHSGPPHGTLPPRNSRIPRRGQSSSGSPPHRDRSPDSPAPRCDEPAGAAAGHLPADAPPPGSPRGDAQAPPRAPTRQAPARASPDHPARDHPRGDPIRSRQPPDHPRYGCQAPTRQAATCQILGSQDPCRLRPRHWAPARHPPPHPAMPWPETPRPAPPPPARSPQPVPAGPAARAGSVRPVWRPVLARRPVPRVRGGRGPGCWT